MNDSPSSHHFTRIRLENWKNFSQIEVDLQRRIFLVGPNAAGKSNFLDVFRFLREISSVGGGFQAAVERRGAVSMLRCLAARRNPEISITVRIGNGESQSRWEYELVFDHDNQLDKPVIRRERILKDGDVLLERPNDADKADPEQLTQTYLEQVNVNRPFREVSEFFGSIRYLHLVPQLIRDPDRSVGLKNDPYGGDFLEQVAMELDRTRTAKFRKIQDALKIAVPQLAKLELERDDRGRPHLRGKYEHWRSQGAWQTEESFSDGTLRLLGFLWALLDQGGPLLLEEPEQSLHPEVVRYIPQILARGQNRSGRQVILSTHSPDLLKDEGIGLDEVLLLVPMGEGTVVRPANAIADVARLLEGGISLPEAIMPHASPPNPEQLALFGEAD